MMIIVGDALFGAGGGRIFMLVEAFTVFLALIGTTLSCMNTGARVTYAMGKDEEVPEHFGLLHGENLTPAPRHLDAGHHLGRRRLHRRGHAVRRCRRSGRRGHQGAAAGLLVELRLHHSRQDGGAAELSADRHAGLELRHFPALRPELHHLHGGATTSIRSSTLVRHMFIPVFGLLANLACMAFYLVGPFMGYRHQDGAAAGAGHCRWSGRIYGGIYFVRSSKRRDGRR